ncbi:hypothetical protein [Candidatus Rariloculus sp.]|uniref:hypothetical protein n=1 Tax=Candidatus Rariloculus sp. TaxID=3101265 RepID=UPI003D0FAFB6
MTSNRSRTWFGMGVLVLGAVPVVVSAQFGAGYGPPLETISPPMEFETSAAHYAYLLEQANGGTQHTFETLPRWDGLWQTAGNTAMQSFVDAPRFEGQVREGVLKPEYDAAYKERWRQQIELGEVQYDRLTHCEPQGYPRILLEPYTHEFINLPHQSFFINDFASSVRRIYIGQEHKNIMGTHSWYGDIIGFWDGDKLVTHTVDLLPADYTRWAPMTSNQFESVEVWELKSYPDGAERLEVQVTFYDSFAFERPVNAVYAYRRAGDLEGAGYRVVHWECELTNNALMDEKGSTTYRLPGEEGFVDPRGFTLFPELPGQSRDPIYNTTLPIE